MEKKVYRVGTLMIIIMALITALLQGNPYTSVVAGADRQPQITMIFLIGFLAAAFYIAGLSKGNMTSEKSILYVIFLGMLMRVSYVLFMDIWTLQNDGGTFTGFGTPDINNGHIGYVE